MSHMEGNYEPHAQNALASSRGIMSHIEWIGYPAWIDFLPCTRTESVDWAVFDMISAEPMRLHRPKAGMRIIIR